MGYVEKRIRLRKTQYQMMQKLAESRKKTVTMALDAEMEQHAPRQTVSKKKEEEEEEDKTPYVSSLRLSKLMPVSSLFDYASTAYMHSSFYLLRHAFFAPSSFLRAFPMRDGEKRKGDEEKKNHILIQDSISSKLPPPPFCNNIYLNFARS